MKLIVKPTYPIFKIFKYPLLLLFLFSALLLSGCTGAASLANSWPGLIVEGDTAYLAYNHHVYAINLVNGSEKWRFPAEADNKISFFAAPVLTPDGQLLAGTYNNILYSLNPVTGVENWQYTGAINRYIASPLATEDAIYAPTASENLYKLDVDGNLLWTFDTSGPLWSQPVFDETCACIYLACMDHYVYAIDAETGALKWKSEKLSGSIVGKPTLSPDGILYVGTFAQEIIAINGVNGKVLWRTSTDGWIWSDLNLTDSRLYFGDLKGSFYALDTTYGEVIWKIQPDGPILGAPVVTEEAIYFGTESGSLYAVDEKGVTLWTQSLKGKLYASPLKNGEMILVSPFGADELLIALDLNGVQKWSFTPAKK